MLVVAVWTVESRSRVSGPACQRNMTIGPVLIGLPAGDWVSYLARRTPMLSLSCHSSVNKRNSSSRESSVEVSVAAVPEGPNRSSDPSAGHPDEPDDRGAWS